MAKKAVTADTSKAKAKVKSIAPKKAAKKKQEINDDFDDDEFNEPVWIDPNKQAEKEVESKKEKPPIALTPLEKEYNVEVTSAKIKDIFLSASWKDMSPENKGSYDRDGENPIHDDLKKAFTALNKHIAAMSEQYNSDGKLDSDKIVCRGFSIGSNGEGVTLHGTRLLSNGKPFNFNTPFYKWDNDPSESLFDEDSNSLRADINNLRSEVIKYLFKHKYQPEIITEAESE